MVDFVCLTVPLNLIDLQAGGSAKVLAWVPAFVYSRDRKQASVARTEGAVDIRIKR